MEKVTAFLNTMLLVLFMYFTATIAVNNENCDHFVRVNNAEVTTLHSPNYPQKEPPGSSCRWTVFADLGRRIILVCPFYSKFEESECRRAFRVAPEFGEETLHCGDKGFSRIGLNHRMVITYQNRGNKTADAFTCYLHAEINSRWHERPPLDIYQPIDNDYAFPSQLQHNFNIKLGEEDMTQLVAPNSSDPDSSWSNILWTVTVPPDSRMILSCPFTDRPPQPLTIQLAPCRGQFIVKDESYSPKQYHCSKQSILFSTTDQKMIILYNNELGPPDDDFLCYVYSEPLAPTKNKIFPSPFKDCDYVIEIHPKSGATIHWHDTLTHVYCRWTVVSPEGSQIKIEGVKSLKPLRPKEIDGCDGIFVFQVAGRNVTEYCLGVGFLRVTPTNWMILINKNLFNNTNPSFRFWVKDVPKKQINESHYFGATGGFENVYEDHVMLLNLRETRLWVSPHYFDVEEKKYNASRLTVVAPPECRIVLTCNVPLKQGTGIPEWTYCRVDITVVTEERNNIFQHCSAKPFAQSSPNNRMVIIFGNPEPLARKPFSCQLYAEEKLPWKLHKGLFLTSLLNPSCNYDIHVPENGMQILSLPQNPGREQGPSSCTWNVFGTRYSRVILSCPHGTQPLQKQFNETCSAYFIVSSKNRPNSTYCRDSPFLRTSANENMTISYANLLPDPVKSYNCFIYSEFILPDYSCQNCNGTLSPPYETCDYIYNLTNHEMRELDFPQHEKPPGTFCRWTVVSPPDSRILLSCPYNSENTENSCNSHFTVHSGGKETRYCSGKNIIEFSSYNWTIVTYDNPSFDFFPAITCFAYVEKKISSNTCVKCTALASLATLDYSHCDITIKINKVGETKYLETPNSPEDMKPGVPCRWTVKGPGTSSITMTCENLIRDDEEEIYENEGCRGLIVIYGSGPDAEYHCRHESFGTRSKGNILIVTYGNQIGSTRKGFKCSLVAEDAVCRHKIFLGRPQYNKYFELSTPDWLGKVSPYPVCYWSIESKKNTQLYLSCGLVKQKGRLVISKSGDEKFSDVEVVQIKSRVVKASVLNKMNIHYDITNTTRPNTRMCRIFVDRNPPLGPECNCGNKFTNRNSIPLDKRRNFAIKEINRKSYTMMAGMYFYLHLGPEILLACAATIISNYFAITSAYCIEKTSGFRIGLAVDIRSNAGELPLIGINYTKVPPNRRIQTGIWDIGILGVERPITFNYRVQPVCLTFHQRDMSYLNESIVTLGWGKIHLIQPRALPHPLLVAEGYVDSAGNCSSLGRFLPGHHYCLNYPKQSDMCLGFEGGPVLWKDPVTGLLKLIGVSITHEKCQSATSKSIAVHMVEVLDWLEETLRDKATFCREE